MSFTDNQIKYFECIINLVVTRACKAQTVLDDLKIF